MASTLLFIVNPRAGRTRSTAPLFDAVAHFCASGYLVDLRLTQAREDATRLARELGGKFDAVVCCGGDREQTVRLSNYNGVLDCVSASLVAGGPKGCEYGCLGMGTCARKCPFGAIEIIHNLAVVHRELCVGCGKCVAACPRGVIKLVPAEAEVHVYCNSPLKGPAKKQVCKVPCLGCRKCARYAPEKFTVNGFRAEVNYGARPLPDAADVQAIGCPTGCLLTAEEHLKIEQNEPDWSPAK